MNVSKYFHIHKKIIPVNMDYTENMKKYILLQSVTIGFWEE